MIMMYRLFIFQKLRGHSKTTWTKRGTKVPGTSVGGISIFVHVFVKKCLVWVVKTQNIVNVGFECPLAALFTKSVTEFQIPFYNFFNISLIVFAHISDIGGQRIRKFKKKRNSEFFGRSG